MQRTPSRGANLLLNTDEPPSNAQLKKSLFLERDVVERHESLDLNTIFKGIRSQQHSVYSCFHKCWHLIPTENAWNSNILVILSDFEGHEGDGGPYGDVEANLAGFVAQAALHDDSGMYCCWHVVTNTRAAKCNPKGHDTRQIEGWWSDGRARCVECNGWGVYAVCRVQIGSRPSEMLCPHLESSQYESEPKMQMVRAGASQKKSLKKNGLGYITLLLNPPPQKLSNKAARRVHTAALKILSTEELKLCSALTDALQEGHETWNNQQHKKPDIATASACRTRRIVLPTNTCSPVDCRRSTYAQEYPKQWISTLDRKILSRLKSIPLRKR
ncbi:hypothetical protein B0H14DRAFT_3173163 [Mycena olivaceomarginata]|nr:hypothetical protein B0H14DRAFT_3173163 [Mycena olivaceomarginata]